jgi:hypothetical protein
MSNTDFIQTCASRCTLTIEQLSERIDQAEARKGSVAVATPAGYPDYWLSLKGANEVLAELFLQQ